MCVAAGWLRAIVPKSAVTVDEEAWNAYPYTKTIYRCQLLANFSIEIETRYFDDHGQQQNVFALAGRELHDRVVGVPFALHSCLLLLFLSSHKSQYGYCRIHIFLFLLLYCPRWPTKWLQCILPTHHSPLFNMVNCFFEYLNIFLLNIRLFQVSITITFLKNTTETMTRPVKQYASLLTSEYLCSKFLLLLNYFLDVTFDVTVSEAFARVILVHIDFSSFFHFALHFPSLHLFNLLENHSITFNFS